MLSLSNGRRGCNATAASDSGVKPRECLGDSFSHFEAMNSSDKASFELSFGKSILSLYWP